MSENTPALSIEYIEVENFKSYAGKHRIGPFHQTFTAVIGPNGSGKSNILDALLFVFGKRANKIRLEKLGELIHSSAAHPDCTSASVTVLFRYSDEVIRLTREVAKHTGSSQYFINGKRQSQASVVTFLKEKGIDLDHNRFLILQGEVEQIALMRPKCEKEGEEGFLEYLEDLIGTNKYIPGIREASGVAEVLQEDRITSLEKSHKLGKEKEILENCKNAAVSYVRKDNQMQKIVSTMCQLKILAGEEELAPQRAEEKALGNRLSEVQRKVKNLEDTVDAETENLNKLNKQIRQYQKEQQDLQAQKDSNEREAQDIKMQLEHSEKEEKRQYDKIKKLNDEMSRISLQLDDIERDKKIALRNMEEASERRDRLDPQFDQMTSSLQEKMRPIRRKKEEQMKQLAPWTAEHNKITNSLNTIEDTLRVSQENVEIKHRECKSENSKMEEMRQQIETAHQSICTIEKQIEEQKRLRSMHSAAKLEKDLDVAQQRKADLVAQIDAIKQDFIASQGDDKITKFLEEQGIDGYYGPLRRLGSIDDRYDIAAGVAAGAYWTYHVVEDENVAQQAIQHLRKNDIGRASFIVLAHQKKEHSTRLAQPFAPPSQSTRLFDLIKPVDVRFLPAFYFAVRDTLVTTTLHVARSIGLGGKTRSRVVTLAGEVVDPVGQVTGGGQARPQGAGLNASSVPTRKNQNVRQELQNLQTQLQNAHSEVLKLREMLTNLRGSEERSARSYEELRRQLQETTMRHRTETLNLSRAEKLCSSALANYEKSKRAVESTEHKRLIGEKESLVSRRLKIDQDCEKYKRELEILDKALEDIGGPEYRRIQEQIQQDKKTVTEQETKLMEAKKNEAKLTSMKNTKLREKHDLEASLENQRGVTTRSETEKLNALQKTLNKIKSNLNDKEHEIEDSFEVKRRGDDTLRNAITEVKRLENEEQDVQEKIKSLQDAIEERRKGLEKYEQAIKTCEEKIFENYSEFGDEVVVLDETSEGSKAHSEKVEELANADTKRFSTCLSSEELARQDFKHQKYLAEQLKMEIDRVRDTIDLQSVARWKEKDTQWRSSKAEYEEIHNKTVEAEKSVCELQDRRKKEFFVAFEDIRSRLRSLYQMLTQGGDADLELVDMHDPFDGINFTVRPARKSWKQIGQLSGGEKTLASLSFVFALHHFKPTPLYIMDEIDAALDFRNVAIVARYVLNQAICAQFIIVSLRNAMFELAHQLLGVCKVRDCTTSIALNPSHVRAQLENRVMLAGKSTDSSESQEAIKRRKISS